MPDETIPTQVAESRSSDGRATTRSGTVFLWLVVASFVAVSLPVIFNGAPLADDFTNCTKGGADGWSGFISESFDKFGLVRLVGHALEIGLIGGLCGHVPFGFLILVPFVLTLGIAVLARGLLRDLGVPSPWPEIAAGAWLLHPLGTEAALWPSALHLPLGLLLALASLRLFRRDHAVLAVFCALLAYQSAEQVIFALPAAVLIVSPAEHRRRDALCAGVAALVTLAMIAVIPGSSFYNDVPLLERLRNVVSDLPYYVELPVIGLGGHSIPQAVLWAFPISLLALVVGGIAGFVLGPRLIRDTERSRMSRLHLLLAFLALMVLVNLPLAMSHHPDSPRNFACSWLLIATFAAAFASTFSWRDPKWVTGVAGMLVAAALLSLALSSSVRVRNSDIIETTISTLETKIRDTSVVAMCDVKRTAFEYAPTGDFALNGFVSFFDDAVLYYTGTQVEFRRQDDLVSGGCPELAGADVVLDFDEVVEEARTG